MAKSKSKVQNKTGEPKSVEQLNETGRRKSTERRQADTAVKSERRQVQRRRQIDPTTCERDYTPEEVEFMQALDQYKRDSGRMFPTCSEILEVIRSLGYEKKVADELMDKTRQPHSTGDHRNYNAVDMNAVDV